eukprot:3665944-Ditylum_brightwellii.AAC.1
MVFYIKDTQTNILVQSLFSEYLNILNPYLHCLLGNLFNQDINPDFWLSALQDGTVEVASDGLVKDNFSKSGKQVIRIQGPVNCHPTMIQSYRVELT